ncbi:GNAT family N-acetyltransferase [Vibrio vulnificus]|uniref:GNAT family N-acetyltransferase n=1 Tax=Vibrio vulnificus TaxID=672 RepID=UPI001A270732|nr:GNAT family N-acetyltransferase [Vibrio vulnificus]EHH0712283.1 GNAT family N-acetyltransferase [Vibrio vulnificus]EHH2473728.1 GNAT family N-acetyltransferase [Vibrio vulnificus]EHH2475475.1 GNAT family N-acetyltransferase [Vibrio vulnificus]EHZ2848257.1 GNAT family N-acetyltransferase [Vibrio vulnificus]
MTDVIIKPAFKFELVDSNFDMKKIVPALESVAPLYPEFNSWFKNKFLTNFYEGKRNILLAHNGDKLCGLSLLKTSPEENKICTFYVMPEFQGKALGSQLMEKSLEYFQGKEVLISVSNERLTELYPVLAAKGFVLDECVEHLYRYENIEHFFKTK